MSTEGTASHLNDNRRAAGASVLAFCSLFIFLKVWSQTRPFLGGSLQGAIQRPLISVASRRAEGGWDVGGWGDRARTIEGKGN